MTVSVDTFRSEVAAKAVETFGPLVVNDISAGELDPAMLSVVADCGVPYIAMHMKGDPKTMQSQTDYRRDIVTEVVGYFRRRTDEMLAAGIRRENIILDHGAELRIARGSAPPLRAGLPGAGGAFAQVDDL